MKKLCYLLLVVFVLISCKKEISKCGVEDPVEELEWLQEWVNWIEESNCICGEHWIYQAIYNNQEVFYQSFRSVNCDGTGAMLLHNCEGELIKTIDFRDDPQAEVPSSVTVIYSCSKFD